MKIVKSIFQTVSIVVLCIIHYQVVAQSDSSINNHLNSKEQSIVTISAFTAKGDIPQLHSALHKGLDAGLTINEIKEILVQLYAYAGFPRSLNALQAFMDVLNDRKQNGMKDVLGKAPTPLPNNLSKLQFGTEIQTKLVGQPVKGEVYQFAPAIDQFLKEHLFGDIFGRDNLDFKTREIATIAALASLDGVENQLRAHKNVGMHNGLTAGQIENLLSIAQLEVGSNERDTAGKIFPKGEKITNNNFIGTVYLQEMVGSDSLNKTQVGNVTFEPGARSNWHYHPGGQILLAIGGTGYYQEKGKPKRLLRKGDTVNCPPNIAHWHGASQDEQFIQVAITNTQNGLTI